MGTKVSIVVTDMLWQDGTGIGRLTPGEQRVRVCGLLPPEVYGFSTVCLLGASFLNVSTLVDLSVDEHCRVLCLQPPQAAHVKNYVELCAGAGFSSLGFVQAGFVPKCAVECQPKLAALHRSIHPGVPVINADITDDMTTALIHEACPQPATIMAGIACQPYSRAGKQDGGQDSRAATLPATMKIANWLQAPVLVLECVVPARSNEYVLAHLRELEGQLKYHVVDFTMKLEEVWSGLRYRWWMVATHKNIGRILVPRYPKGSTLVVRDLMPYTRRWSEEEEDQLTLNAQELERFQLGGEPLRKYLVQADQKLPTALHSWGGQTLGCACECRSLGFADVTLQSRGLFAQLLQIPGLGNQTKYRHMHAVEVAIHNGVPPLQQWCRDARLNLCAVGQLASPMHSVWLATSIMAHMQKLFTHEVPTDPLQALSDLKTLVQQQSREFFPVIPRSVGLVSSPAETEATVTTCQVQISDHQGPSWTLKHQPESTVRNLLEAECDLLHMPLFDMQVCGLNGLPLPEDAKLTDHDAVMLVSPDCGPSSVCSAVEFVPFLPEDLVSVCPTSGSAFCVRPGGVLLETQVDSDVEGNMMELSPEHLTFHVAEDGMSDSAGRNAVAMQSLLQLSVVALLELLPPLVADVELCESLRSQRVQWACRDQLLAHQQHAWADDEMLWHMKAAAMMAQKPTAVLDPLLATTWVSAGTVASVRAWVETVSEPTDRFLSVVWSHGHWIPVLWIVKQTCLEVHTYDHDDQDLNCLNGLHGLLCQAFDVPSFTVSCLRRSFGKCLCGAAAIGFFIAKLSDSMMPKDDPDLQQLDSLLRNQFRLSHSSAGEVRRPWCWGAGLDELPGLLANLLQFHGVPSAMSKQRAKLVIQSLGKDAVKKALEGVSPWKSLKHAANQHQPAIQLVMPDELAAVVQEKKAKKSAPQDAKSKKPRQVPMQPVDIDPGRLVLEPDTFCSMPDVMLPQIQLSQVGPLATGVALVTYAEALPFLQTSKVLTTKGLALVIVNCPAEVQTDLQWSTIRFAAKCAANQQPVLLHGVLVQLGSTSVSPYHRPTSVVVPDVPVACARITVFQDQWPQDWESFMAHPVKETLQRIPPLQTCRNEECSCDKWHKDPMQPAHDVVLDVFRRQFFSDGGRPVKAHQASHFSVQVRFLKCQEAAVLKCSGLAGLYIEPRLPDSSMPSDEYQVIWMPQSSFAEVQHSMQCEPHSTGLARTGRTYGIRVLAKHYQMMFAKLKPDSQFLAPGARMLWHCGPWPFGSDRKMLAKVCCDMQWQARPLQPAMTVEGGVMWLLQSVTEPPQAVWNLQHGPVVVSRCDSMSANVSQSSHVIGPQSTVELCSTKAETDPWLTKDPWQGSLTTVAVQSSPNVATQIQEMEERLEKSILSKLPCERMEMDEEDTRVQQLEFQLHQLANRQQSLESLVNDHHSQHTAQVQTLQAQMMSQMEVQRTQMKGMFDDQMQRLEAILAKKGRHE